VARKARKRKELRLSKWFNYRGRPSILCSLNLSLESVMEIIKRIDELRILRNRSRKSEVYAITARNEL